MGALVALWVVTVLAATLGSQMSRALTPTLLNRLSAGLFVGVGALIIASALLSA